MEDMFGHHNVPIKPKVSTESEVQFMGLLCWLHCRALGVAACCIHVCKNYFIALQIATEKVGCWHLQKLSKRGFFLSESITFLYRPMQVSALLGIIFKANLYI